MRNCNHCDSTFTVCLLKDYPKLNKDENGLPFGPTDILEPARGLTIPIG